MNTIKNVKFIKENADFGTVVPVFIKAIKPEKATKPVDSLAVGLVAFIRLSYIR